VDAEQEIGEDEADDDEGVSAGGEGPESLADEELAQEADWDDERTQILASAGICADVGLLNPVFRKENEKDAAEITILSAACLQIASLPVVPPGMLFVEGDDAGLETDRVIGERVVLQAKIHVDTHDGRRVKIERVVKGGVEGLDWAGSTLSEGSARGRSLMRLKSTMHCCAGFAGLDSRLCSWRDDTASRHATTSTNTHKEALRRW
jgi:hypothetical protein